MSDGDWSRRATGLLLNALQKRAWGESLDDLDPGDFVEELRSAISNGIMVIGDRGALELLDLFRRYAGSASRTVSMLSWASRLEGSDALRTACEQAVQEAGPAVIELLREALAEETDEESTVDLLFGACRVAVHTITDLSERLEILRVAYEQATDATDDPAIAKSLRAGLTAAAQQKEGQAAETLLDHYQDEAAYHAGYPWPLLEGLIGTLGTIRGPASCNEESIEVLMRALRRAIVDEGPRLLWEGYQSLLDWCGTSRCCEPLGWAAKALCLPTTAANLLAVTHIVTHREERDADIEHALGVLAAAIAVLDDPAGEAIVMHSAYITAVADGNDPASAMEPLLEATGEAIAKAVDPAGAVGVLLEGLSVQPDSPSLRGVCRCRRSRSRLSARVLATCQDYPGVLVAVLDSLSERVVVGHL